MKKHLGLAAVLATAAFGIGIVGHVTPRAQAATPETYGLKAIENSTLASNMFTVADYRVCGRTWTARRPRATRRRRWQWRQRRQRRWLSAPKPKRCERH